VRFQRLLAGVGEEAVAEVVEERGEAHGVRVAVGERGGARPEGELVAQAGREPGGEDRHADRVAEAGVVGRRVGEEGGAELVDPPQPLEAGCRGAVSQVKRWEPRGRG
jgi:hypothetical protein